MCCVYKQNIKKVIYFIDTHLPFFMLRTDPLVVLSYISLMYNSICLASLITNIFVMQNWIESGCAFKFNSQGITSLSGFG